MFQSWYDRTRRPEVQKPRLDHPRNLVDNLKLFFLGIFSDEHAIKIHDSLIKWLIIIVTGHFRSYIGVSAFWSTSRGERDFSCESYDVTAKYSETKNLYDSLSKMTLIHLKSVKKSFWPNGLKIDNQGLHIGTSNIIFSNCFIFLTSWFFQA